MKNIHFSLLGIERYGDCYVLVHRAVHFDFHFVFIWAANVSIFLINAGRFIFN